MKRIDRMMLVKLTSNPTPAANEIDPQHLAGRGWK